jgi:hypothetical protein
MNALRKNPLFTVALVGLGVAILAEAWWLQASHTAWRMARRQLDAARRELRAVNSLTPAATPENAALIAEDLADCQRQLAALQAELTDDGRLADGSENVLAPSQRSGAFFDIATFVERMRDLAQRNGVQLKPDERFGFSAYAHEAPESAYIPEVLQERIMVQHLMETLVAAHPHELVFVQRERRAPERPSASSVAGMTPRRMAGPAGDHFEMDPRISLRAPGAVETRAFRLSFTGHTAVLREWLNRLADSELPALVRLVEVAPVETTAGGFAASEPGAVPLVPRRMSRFTVTVEWIDVGALDMNGT